MTNTMIEVFKKYGYDYSCINMKQPTENIISQVEEDLIRKPYSVDTAREMICSLWILQKNENKKNLQFGGFKSFLDEISNRPDYIIKNGFIHCNKFIHCCSVKTFHAFHILNENQIQKLTDMGYGIKSFKVEISDVIRDIYCIGKHPNLSSTSKTFCFDNDIRDIKLSSDSLDLVEGMLSQINLSSNFLEESEFNKIMEVVECQSRQKVIL